MTALFTGMRKKAILHLSWKDIDTKHNVIYLSAVHSKKKTGRLYSLAAADKKNFTATAKARELYFFK